MCFQLLYVFKDFSEGIIKTIVSTIGRNKSIIKPTQIKELYSNIPAIVKCFSLI